VPTIKRKRDVAANGEDFPLVGSQYEYLPFDARVDVALLADTGDELEGTVYSGSDVLLEGSQLDEKALASPVVWPDDFSLTDVAAQGERLGIKVRETAGAISTYRIVVRITPI